MMRFALSVAAAASLLVEFAAGECLSNPEFNDFFEELAGGPIPQEGSCCQLDVCGIPCPEPTPPPGIGKLRPDVDANGALGTWPAHLFFS
jgi:hypothetical protein